MADFRADLHCHSTCSDGTHSPEDLIALAHELGLGGFSITDHDTVDAYETVLAVAAKCKLEMISGVEFSCVHRSHSVHVLGYSFSIQSPSIRQLCKRHLQRRINRYRAILDLLTRENMPISEDELTAPYPKKNIGRPHIALAMIQKGYIKSIEEAFHKFLGEGKPCYVKGEAISVEETIHTIHDGGGLAIIAHPHLMKRPDILKYLLDMKFDGIEGYYARFTREDNQRWLEIGKKKGWIITGGSDFHGNIKPQIPLGCSWVDEPTFRILQKHFHGNNPVL